MLRTLNRLYAGCALAFGLFVGVMAVLERLGLPKTWIGGIFLLGTVLFYAAIGVMGRTTDPAEYYVAGRRVPAFYNGMATAADWMSAASFISLAGTLYLTGYGGLAFILGWTGGYCLVALLLAPYLRRFGQYTIPDFVGARYGGHLPRAIAALCAVLCSFTYLVAQIYGVGLIAARLTGLDFFVGVFIGLGSVLVCSFLGGMRAVTWTQVAQYIVMIVAYLVPVVWLGMNQTGVPVPQLIYGQQLHKLSEREQQLLADPKEREVVAIFQRRADEAAAKLRDVPRAMAADRERLQAQLARQTAAQAPPGDIRATMRALALLPRSEDEAARLYARQKADDEARAKPLAGLPPHGQIFEGDPDGDAARRQAFEDSRRNFLALVFCLMLGTAGLPHLLVRSYTTPTVSAARDSVFWSVVFIALLYFTAPALAVLVKFEVFEHLVGQPFDQLPAWIANWARVDPALLQVSDVNEDRLLQLGEMKIGGDIVMLAAPEIAGLPFVVFGMVAAGALAAALSTADGLLLTIANALSHDLYFRVAQPGVSTAHRVAVSKALLLVAAVLAALVAAQRPADIVFLVASAFSLAASALFPTLVLGVFWRRATGWGATLGMLGGLGMTLYYMFTTHPWLSQLLGAAPRPLWWGVQPISGGLFGVLAGTALLVVASLLTPRPGAEAQALLDRLRSPQEAEAPPVAGR
jgi:cation/acetate symporter